MCIFFPQFCSEAYENIEKEGQQFLGAAVDLISGLKCYTYTRHDRTIKELSTFLQIYHKNIS